MIRRYDLKRGDLYRVHKPSGDVKRQRVFVVVSRQMLVDSGFSTVICAPVFTVGQGLSTQLRVGLGEGLKHESWIMCDNLMSLRKRELTNFVGSLPQSRFAELDRALRIALAVD